MADQNDSQKTVKVKFKRDYFGTYGVFKKGKIETLPEKVANSFIKSKAAEKAD